MKIKQPLKELNNMINWSKAKVDLPFILIILTISFSCIYYSTKSEIKEWDESRNGINAYEMRNNQNYLVPYFENKVDTWNAKPPLLIWAITISYKVFGLNTFSLRFPSLVSTLVFFLIFYKIALFFANAEVVRFAVLIMFSCKAVLWDHIGLTGDFDSILLASIFLTLYFILNYSINGKNSSIIYAALFLGLGFYAKGLAVLILIPSIILFTYLRKPQIELPRPRSTFYLSIIIFFSIIFSWIVLSKFYIHYPHISYYGSKSQVETMFYHDIINRLFIKNFDSFSDQKSWSFFFSAIDIRMNLWNYLFYIFLTLNFLKFNLPLDKKLKDLMLLSYCVVLPVAVLLTISQNQHNWYLAPVYPFIAIIISINLIQFFYISKLKWLVLVFAFALFIRHNFELLTNLKTIKTSENLKTVVMGNKVHYVNLPQHYILKLIFLESELVKLPESNFNSKNYSGIWVIDPNHSELREKTNEIAKIGEFKVIKFD